MTTRQGTRFQDKSAGSNETNEVNTPTSVHSNEEDNQTPNALEDGHEEEINNNDADVNNIGEDQVPNGQGEMLYPFGSAASSLTTDHGEPENTPLPQSDQGSDGASRGEAVQATNPGENSIMARTPNRESINNPEPVRLATGDVHHHYIQDEMQWQRAVDEAFRQAPEHVRNRIRTSQESERNAYSSNEATSSKDNSHVTPTARPRNQGSGPGATSTPSQIITNINKGKGKERVTFSDHDNGKEGDTIKEILINRDELMAKRLQAELNPLIPGYQHVSNPEEPQQAPIMKQKEEEEEEENPFTLPNLENLRNFTPSRRLLPPPLGTKAIKASSQIPTNGYLANVFKDNDEGDRPSTSTTVGTGPPSSSTGIASDKKNISWKLQAPSKYDGTADYDIYEKWAYDVNWWFTMQSFPNEWRVAYIGTFLSGKAAKWYMTFVAPKLKEYKLPRLSRELFEYCFPPRLRSDMRNKFNNATQGNRPLTEFISYLLTIASRVPDLTERNIVLRLWSGVQPFIRNKWAENGYDAELSDLESLEIAGLRYEIASRLMSSEQRDGKSSNSQPRTNDERHRKGPRNQTQIKGKSNNWKNDQRKTIIPGNKDKDQTNSKFGHTNPANNKFQQKKFSGQGSNKNARSNSSTSRAGGSRPSKNELRTEGKCFTCYETGHITRDCPKNNSLTYSRPQISMVSLKVGQLNQRRPLLTMETLSIQPLFSMEANQDQGQEEEAQSSADSLASLDYSRVDELNQQVLVGDIPGMEEEEALAVIWGDGTEFGEFESEGDVTDENIEPPGLINPPQELLVWVNHTTQLHYDELEELEVDQPGDIAPPLDDFQPLRLSMLDIESDELLRSIEDIGVGFEPFTIDQLEDEARLADQLELGTWYYLNPDEIRQLDARAQCLSYMGDTNYFTDGRTYEEDVQRVMWARTGTKLVLFDRFTGTGYTFFLDGFFTLSFTDLLDDFSHKVWRACEKIVAKGPDNPYFTRHKLVMSRLFQLSDLWRKRISYRLRIEIPDIFPFDIPILELGVAPGHPDVSEAKLVIKADAAEPTVHQARYMNAISTVLLGCSTHGIRSALKFSKIVPRHRIRLEDDHVLVEDALTPYVSIIPTWVFFNLECNHISIIDSGTYHDPIRQGLPSFETWLAIRSDPPADLYSNGQAVDPLRYYYKPNYSPLIGNRTPTTPAMKMALNSAIGRLEMLNNQSKTLEGVVERPWKRFLWRHDGQSLPFILDAWQDRQYNMREEDLRKGPDELTDFLINTFGPFSIDKDYLEYDVVVGEERQKRLQGTDIGDVSDGTEIDVLVNGIDSIYPSADSDDDRVLAVSTKYSTQRDILEVHPEAEKVRLRIQMHEDEDERVRRMQEPTPSAKHGYIAARLFRKSQAMEFRQSEELYLDRLPSSALQLIDLTRGCETKSISPISNEDSPIPYLQNLFEDNANNSEEDVEEQLPIIGLEINRIFLRNRIKQCAETSDDSDMISIVSELTSELIYEDSESGTDSDFSIIVSDWNNDEVLWNYSSQNLSSSAHSSMPSLISLSDSESDLDPASRLAPDTEHLDDKSEYEVEDEWLLFHPNRGGVIHPDNDKFSYSNIDDKSVSEPETKADSPVVVTRPPDSHIQNSELKGEAASLESNHQRLKPLIQLQALPIQSGSKSKATRLKKKSKGNSQPMKTISKTERSAVKPKDEKRLVPLHMTVPVRINGSPSDALIDSGSLSDIVSTTLVDQLKLPKVELKEPLTYSLAASGSKTKVQYYSMLEIEIHGIKEVRRFDVMNTENHHVILGTPFLFQHSVCFGFNPFSIDIGSKEQKPIAGQEVAMIETLYVSMENKTVGDARQLLISEAQDLCKSAAETPLPPFRDINHTIPIIDESKRYASRRVACPEAFKPEWRAKRDAYVKSGRWRFAVGVNAAPMLFVKKKPGPDGIAKLRTVFDKREVNDNTRKMVSPLPNMEMILSNVLRHKYRSLIDGKDAYEQIRIEPEYVKHTLFNTPDGTMESLVIQQGDCNGGATYQALMNRIFSPYIGVFMDVYLDDIIIYSDTVEDHIKHVRTILDILRREKLYLTTSDKLQFFAEVLNILGHVIDEDGLVMDPHKVDSIQNWKVPTSKTLLSSFLGAVGYLAPNCQGIRVPMAPLAKLSGAKSKWEWNDTHQRAFDQVKEGVVKWRNNHRRAIDYSPNAPKVNLICDASLTGAGGTLSQGDDPLKAHIIAFWSAKFNPAQQNYAVHEREMLAIVEALKRFRHLLQGIKFRIYTDHKPLQFLKTQPKLSARQQRWIDEMSGFDFDIIYVPGEENNMADALSRMYTEEPAGTIRATSEMIGEGNTGIEHLLSGGLSVFSINSPIYTGPAASTRSKMRRLLISGESSDNSETSADSSRKEVRTRDRSERVRNIRKEWDHHDAAVLPLTEAARSAIINKPKQPRQKKRKPIVPEKLKKALRISRKKIPPEQLEDTTAISDISHSSIEQYHPTMGLNNQTMGTLDGNPTQTLCENTASNSPEITDGASRITDAGSIGNRSVPSSDWITMRQQPNELIVPDNSSSIVDINNNNEEQQTLHSTENRDLIRPMETHVNDDSRLPPLVELFEQAEPHLDFPNCLKEAYKSDKFFDQITEAPEQYRNFVKEDGLYLLKDNGQVLLCVPNTMVDKVSIREALIEQAHSILAHLGSRKTFLYLRENLWWPTMRKDIDIYVAGCRLCASQKSRTQAPYGLLKTLEVPSLPWQTIGIDFLGPLPLSKTRSGEFDMLTVIVDHLTHMVHLVPSKQTYNTRHIAELVFDSVYKLHGLPQAIVSDRDSYFTSRFWQQLHDLIGVKLKMSTAYHPQSDGLTERMNRTIAQMLRHCINQNQYRWATALPAIEFAINSATSDTTGFSPFYLNYGRPINPLLWNSHQDLYPGVRAFTQQIREAQILAHDSILTERVKQTGRSNKSRRPAPFSVGDLVYLSTVNLKLPKGRSRKLTPKYIGPFKITREVSKGSTYTLDLPNEMKQRDIHANFHASLLRIHIPNDDRRFPGRMYQPNQTLGVESNEGLIDSIESHTGKGTNSAFLVKWKAGDQSWLPYTAVRHLTALETYLELIGANSIRFLPDKPAKTMSEFSLSD